MLSVHGSVIFIGYSMFLFMDFEVVKVSDFFFFLTLFQLLLSLSSLWDLKTWTMKQMYCCV